jgi:hypothetical protein
MNWRPKANEMAEVKKGLWRLKWASDWFGAWPIGRARLFRAQRLRKHGDNFLRRANEKVISQKNRRVRGRGQ